MKATDLMIGDWVLYAGKPNIITEVSEIIHGEATVCFVGNNYMANMDEIKPIPITKEILEKNGWKKLETAYWWRGDGISVLLDMYDERYGWCLSIDRNHIPFDCKYVHQLQQAMRLCGITKEIEL